ncbi:MAG: hypothetical protein K1X29_04845 [Bdellovibrionales bacterium]|nr:hypothetical protein [Bdellovibrionales bacterium]
MNISKFTFFICLSLILPLSDPIHAQQALTEKLSCQTAREFITTQNYLSEKKELSLSPEKITEISHEVSTGCTGAAKRFIRVFQSLTKVELSGADSLKLALSIAKKDDNYADSFLGVFQHSYLRDHLDLDLQTSVQMATDLSLSFKGNVKLALKDFSELSQFCLSQNGLNLPIKNCASLAHKVTLSGELYAESMANVFKDTFEFLTNESTLKMPLIEAISWAQKIVAMGPKASQNFILAYRYAIKQNGMSYSSGKALQFASLLASRTYPITGSTNDLRLPASTN